MNTKVLSATALVLGVFGVSLAACSAESTAPKKSPGSGNTGNVGTGNTGNVGTGNTGNVGTGNTGNVGTGNTGNVLGAGGSGNTGNVPGAGGTLGTAGAPTGGGGSGTCLTPTLIDDLEDGDNVIAPCGGRIGYWYTYNDKGAVPAPPAAQTPSACMQTPAPDPTGAIPFLPTGTGNGTSMHSAKTSGSLCSTFGAGLGVDFKNVGGVEQPYDASLYTGIRFFAMGNVAIRAQITTPAVIPVARGGTCATGCDNPHGSQFTLTTTWTMYELPFATILQPMFGTVAAFNKAQIVALQFQVAANATFDFSIDDVTFY